MSDPTTPSVYVGTDIFEAWREGTLTDVQALTFLSSELGEVESEIAPHAARREELRDAISQVVARFDKPVSIPGFGKIELTSPSITKGWDSKALMTLLDDLLFESPELAQRLARCRTESQRAGSLRITREKGTK